MGIIDSQDLASVEQLNLWIKHHLHLTDGNDACCFIAVHARANDGVQQASIIVAKGGNNSIGVGGFWWQQ